MISIMQKHDKDRSCIRACRHGNALWCGCWKHQVSPRTVNRALSKSRDSVCANIYIIQHIRDHGTFKPQIHDPSRGKTDRILEAEEHILERGEEKPNIRTRRLTAEVSVSQFVVHRTLKEQGLHPYHDQKVQALEPADFPRRIIYYAMS